MPAQPIDILVIGKVLIVGKIVLQDEQQDNADGNSERKSEDVEHREKLILQKNTDKEFEVSLKHNGSGIYEDRMLFWSKKFELLNKGADRKNGEFVTILPDKFFALLNFEHITFRNDYL